MLCEPYGIFVGDLALGEQVTQTLEQFHTGGVIPLRELQAFDAGVGGADFGELERTVVDEHHCVGGYVPQLENASNGGRFRLPVHFYGKDRRRRDTQVAALQGLVDDLAVVLARDGNQYTRICQRLQ